ncbi:MAG TPA: DUF3467 domain-containing protein, partial [Burkholderiales bacterium]
MAWDDSGARTVSANVVQVKCSREEATLLFGNRSGDAATAVLEAAVMLPPTTAKWLAGALREVLRRHEARFGPHGDERRASAGPEFPAAERHSAPPDDLAHPQGRRLFQLVCGLGVPFGYEKSFKLAHGRVFPNRFLVAARGRDLRPAAVLEVCRRLGMPQAMSADFETGLGQASTVGFGFEEGARGCMFKAYLEFWDRVREAVLGDPRRDPLLLHLGYKWNCDDASQSAVARYVVHPLLPVPGILERLRGLMPAGENHGGLDAVEQVLSLARARIPSTDTFVYVEATEEGNPRRSFDV